LIYVCKSWTVLGVHIGVYQPCTDVKRTLVAYVRAYWHEC